MSKKQKDPSCPCGAGKRYADCCAPYHANALDAPTADILMRSRYSAYVLKNADYLRKSWHPDTCPADIDVDDRFIKWTGLEIVACVGGGATDAEGTVRFVARYKSGGKAGKMTETSRFVRHENRWVYVDGEMDTLPPV